MDKALLQRSLALVDDGDTGLTVRFYEILFERYPEVRPMFGSDTTPQARMLREAIIAVLGHLDDAAWLADTLGVLGARHAGYGVSEPMYDAVAECLLAAMSERGGQDWTPQMSAAWTEALGAVSGLMLAGYPQAAAS